MWGMPQAAALAIDIPCARCGYNLRGLGHDGNCPECSYHVGISVSTWHETRAANPSLESGGASWIRRLFGGVVLSLLVFLIMLAPAVMARWGVAWRLSTAMLATQCAMWGLSWAAAWTMTTREPGIRRVGAMARCALRISATMYLVLLFLSIFSNEWNAPNNVEVSIAITFVIAGTIAAGAWFIHIGNLARRAGSRSMWIQSRILALLGAGGSVLFLLGPAPHSESRLTWLPLCQFGPAAVISAWLERDVSAILLTLSLLPLWSAFLSLRLSFFLWHAALRAESSNIA